MADPDSDGQTRELLERRIQELEAQVRAARESEELLRSILDTVPSFILEADPDGTIRFINRVAPGLGVDDVVGMSVFDFTAAEYHAAARSAIDAVMRGDGPASYESAGVGAYGKPARYFTRMAPHHRDGKVESVILVANDITELEAAREELHESGEKLAVLMEASGVGLWAWQRVSDLVTWDAATCRLFGRESSPRSYDEYLSCIHPDDRSMMHDHVARVVSTGVYPDVEHRVLLPDGNVRWILNKARVVKGEDGQVTQLLGGVLDITERRGLAEQLVHAQKMEAVGQLAAGIAHNFNNMLTVILSSMELARRKSSGEVAGLLTDGQHAAERAASMVKQLMLFSGKNRKQSRAIVDVGTVAARTVEMCRTTFQRDISLVLEAEPEPALARCDPAQLEQAMLNLLINARDALETVEHRAKEIRVGVRRDVDRNLIKISVIDSGTGMSEEVRRHVFEPFFTTKEVGRGTGLGLAMTYAIIQEHSGRVEIESTEGSGTTATIFLPAQSQSDLDRVQSSLGAARGGNGERVLIVDDEPMIRDLVARMLGESGYSVETAADGIEAIERVRQRVGQIRVVLLDQSMPRLAGRAALRALRALDPGLKVICFSGYAVELEGADAVLEKPATAERLLSVLNRVLHAP